MSKRTPDAEEYARARARAEAAYVTPKRRPRPADPDAVSSGETKYGCWVSFWGMKVYYGRCKDCSELVTDLREADIGGRWPALCDECRNRKAENHDNGAAGRMRKARTRFGPVNDLRRFNGDHHHKDDDDFGIPKIDVAEDHWDPRHQGTQYGKHVRTSPGDYPRGTTPGRR